jgi:hypothetical protein
VTNPELIELRRITSVYLALPFVPVANLGPPVSSLRLNQAYLMPSGTVTDANRTQYATISASASVIFPRSQIMAAPTLIAPTLKGTFFYDQAGAGSSQSFYAVTGAPNAPTSFGAMMQSMILLGNPRTRLSQTRTNPRCRNPFVIRAIRVDDQTTKRKGLLNTNPGISVDSYTIPGSGVQPTPIDQANDDDDAAFKVIFTDSFGNSATQYFHSVPLAAELVDIPGGGIERDTRPGFGSRYPEIDSQWITNINNFTNNLRSLGLGLRFTFPQWTPGGLPVGVIPNQILAVGNGTPIAVTYAYAGYGLQTYTFQIPVPASPIIGKFRVILREFVNLRVLNGRWPAFGFMVGSNYFVNVRHRAANYTPWDGNGYLSPEVWSTFQPAAAPPISGSDFSGVSGVVLTSKKMGRPFGQQRGRQRARAT